MSVFKALAILPDLSGKAASVSSPLASTECPPQLDLATFEYYHFHTKNTSSYSPAP